MKPINKHTHTGTGKMPPHSKELEETILANVITNGELITELLAVFQNREIFYFESNRVIFDCLLKLNRNNRTPDLITVIEEIKQHKEANASVTNHATEISTSIGLIQSKKIAENAVVLMQYYVKRQMITVSQQIINDCYDNTTNSFDILADLTRILSELEATLTIAQHRLLPEIVNELNQITERITNDPGSVSGVPSNLNNLDRLTYGWQDSDLIILAARPGMGKTSFALQIATSAAEYNFPVGFFSLEMSDKQLVARIIAQKSQISAVKQLKTGITNPDEYKKYLKCSHEVSELPLYIEDKPSISVIELRARARTFVQKYGVKMIVIDYLQLMRSGSDQKNRNRENEISEISRELKGIAKELDIPVIALSQLSRSVETRGGAKRPQLSDLRESGAIEQDADMVMFLYRPDYYGIHETDMGEALENGYTEAIIAKHRSGALNTAELIFDHEYTSFRDKNDFENTGGQFPVQSEEF